MDYTIYKSMNPINPNGGVSGCWGWKVYCDVKNAETMRHAVAMSIPSKFLEHVNTFNRNGKIRSVYKNELGIYAAVEVNS